MAKFFPASAFLLFFLISGSPIIKGQDSSNKNASIIKVTLLGTGTPLPTMDRFGPGILVQAGGKTLLFDAGRGCLQRLRQLDIAYDSLDALFLTHLHSDHIVGLPDLWLTGWLVSRRNKPLLVFGPKGSKEMTGYLQKAYAYDIKIRVEDDHSPAEGSKLLVTDINEGIVYDKDGIKVIAFLVDHYPVVPAFGYRIEYNGHSVVLSGDTRYSENLISFAKGADILIHEVVIAPLTISKTDPKYAILAHHTTPEQASRIFNIVKPKLAVYSHISRPYGQTAEEIIKRTRVDYDGALIVGEDLMSFSVSDSVTVKAWDKK